MKNAIRPIGITRVRNEALIIRDTIEHFLQYCEHIILYDDCSDDDTADIAEKTGGNRITVIQGLKWEKTRLIEETRHRALLLEEVMDMHAEWCLCFDADERLIGDLPSDPPPECNGYRFRLFDGYITSTMSADYIDGPLIDLPRMWGPEYRDILMLFRTPGAKYIGMDKREPDMDGLIALADVFVKHFGKCLSINHWEETCDYYINHFPIHFKRKWLRRKGKAIHVRSDFNRRLLTWDNLMMKKATWQKLK